MRKDLPPNAQRLAPGALADVYAARQVVRRYLPPTPLIHAPGLSRRFGCDVHVKCENLSPIRSFKARGAIYCLSRLDAAMTGVVCASTGNHGQGMALAARLFGRRAVVVVPRTTTEQKMVAIRHFGAELRVEGADLAEAGTFAQQMATEEGLLYVEDGEHPDVLVGCATLALEVVEQLPGVQHLIVPVGGGNLIAACSLVLQGLRLDTALTGVQSAAAPAVYESWRAGHHLSLQHGLSPATVGRRRDAAGRRGGLDRGGALDAGRDGPVARGSRRRGPGRADGRARALYRPAGRAASQRRELRADHLERVAGRRAGRVTDRLARALAAVDAEALVRLTGDLVRFPSVTPPGTEEAIARFLAERFRSRGLAVELQEVAPGRFNAIGRLGPSGGHPHLVLNGHLDVMPAGEGWSLPPFEPTIREGRLYGRGSSDMKGGLAAMICAVEAVAAAQIPLEGTITLAAVADEEGYQAGTRRFVESAGPD